MNASDFSEGEIDTLTHNGLIAIGYREEDIECFKEAGRPWVNSRIAAANILDGGKPVWTNEFVIAVRDGGAAILARRAAPMAPPVDRFDNYATAAPLSFDVIRKAFRDFKVMAPQVPFAYMPALAALDDVPGYIRPPLTPAPRTGRPAVEWSKPADNARPHTTVRDSLDALLRFVLGNPNGERWLGAASWRAICAHGNGYRRDRCVPYRDPEVRDLATRLLECLSLIPGPSTNRWLSIDEQREYERLRVELRRAMESSRG